MGELHYRQAANGTYYAIDEDEVVEAATESEEDVKKNLLEPAPPKAPKVRKPRKKKAESMEAFMKRRNK